MTNTNFVYFYKNDLGLSVGTLICEVAVKEQGSTLNTTDIQCFGIWLN